jgi:hypothetical protein
LFFCDTFATMTWDVFISHAAADKDEIARPLAHALRDAGYSVWYDEFTLALGDSLIRNIDRGLAESRYGIVIISPEFLTKDWPRRELEGLVTREMGRGKVLLPVWHQVTREQIERYSPPLADRLGVSTDRGLVHVVAQIRQVLDGTAAPDVTAPPSDQRRRRLIAGGSAALLAVAGAGVWQWQARRMASAEAIQAQRSTVPDAFHASPKTTLDAIAGLWRIEASGAMLRSTLDLRVADGQLEGTAQTHFPDHPDFVLSGLYAQRKVPIAEARWDGERLSFVTRRQFRQSLSVDSPLTTQLLRYRGRLAEGVLALTVEVEGGPTVDVQAHRPPPPPQGTSLVATLPAPAQTSTDRLSALPNGAVAAIYGGGTVRLWRIDAASGKASWAQWQQENTVEGLAPLGLDRLLVVDTYGAMQERDARSGDKRRDLPRLPLPAGAVLPLDGGLVAIGTSVGGIVLWNSGSQKIERTLRDSGTQITRLARLPDGRIVSGDSNNTLRVWSLTSGRVERTLLKGDSSIGSGPGGLVALSDGRIVAGDPRNQPPLLIEPLSGQSSRIDLGGPTASSTVLGLTHDGDVLLADSRLLVSCWNALTGTSRPLVDFSADEIGVDCALSLSPTRLLLGRRDGTLQLWAIG